jgi:N-acetylmuramic acid 6-phosphate etherase
MKVKRGGNLQWKTDKLLTEQVNGRSVNIDKLDTEGILRVINEEDQKVAAAVEREIPNIAKAVDAIVRTLGNGGRLVYLGAGTSGRLGILDAAECPPTFSADPGQVIGLIAGGEIALVKAVEGAEDDSEAAIEQLKAIGFSAHDILVGIAASGRTPFVLGGLSYANDLGACTIGLSFTPASRISCCAKLAVTPLVGPEVITGSTRMKAGTATKLILNMFTTAAMIRLGKVYGNLMVDVRPTNEKLRERAERIVVEAAGVSRAQATEALKLSANNVKTAIVMLKLGCSAEQAETILAGCDGYIARAITKGEKEMQQ